MCQWGTIPKQEAAAPAGRLVARQTKAKQVSIRKSHVSHRRNLQISKPAALSRACRGERGNK
jgi:hypothetical protein